MRLASIENRLLPGSQLFRVGRWKRMTKLELKGLILRFATREHRCRLESLPTFCWRRRRLGAVAVFEKRFERAPEIFRAHKLPRMKSYYVQNGRYVWIGKPVWGTGHSGKAA